MSPFQNDPMERNGRSENWMKKPLFFLLTPNPFSRLAHQIFHPTQITHYLLSPPTEAVLVWDDQVRCYLLPQNELSTHHTTHQSSPHWGEPHMNLCSRKILEAMTGGDRRGGWLQQWRREKPAHEKVEKARANKKITVGLCCWVEINKENRKSRKGKWGDCWIRKGVRWLVEEILNAQKGKPLGICVFCLFLSLSLFSFWSTCFVPFFSNFLKFLL